MERWEMASFPNREENRDWVKRHAGSMARKGAQAVALQSLESYGCLIFFKCGFGASLGNGIARTIAFPNGVWERGRRLIVNVPAVADFHDQDDKLVILDQTHKPVVTHAISPRSFDRKIGLTETTRVFNRFQVFCDIFFNIPLG